MSQAQPTDANIAAIIAAAGRSTRMGEPKQLLPWGNATVIEAVVRHLLAADVAPVVCVVGHQHDAVAQALQGTPAQVVMNEQYKTAEMLTSYQAGIRALRRHEATAPHVACAGALFALGDQPHIPSAVIRQIVEQAKRTPDAPVIPSYAMRRGHPFYLPRAIFSEIEALAPDDMLRTVVNRHSQEIVYVEVESDAILHDMDTPDEYAARKAEISASE